MSKDVSVDEINELLDAGMTKKEAGEHLGISAQKVGMVLAKEKAIEGEVIDNKHPSMFAKTYNRDNLAENNSNIQIMTAREYGEYSKANGRFEGRKEGQKLECSIEALRSLINAGKKPKYIMNKFGINEDDFKQIVWRLSKQELRDRPLRFNIKEDYIEVG